MRLRVATRAPARRSLLRWYQRHRRPLPWRGSPSAYRVWISEVMLQQTQVATVVPHYQRFLRAFPTVRVLAAAPLERVLKQWSGLGYYRRARHLHQAARAIVRDFGGRIPREIESLRSLPGVGDYTARAILSIAYGKPYPVIDGNVARVAARLLALRGNLHRRGFRSAIEGELSLLLSRRHPSEFNQAVMELGQTVCAPRRPRCPLCPLRRWCRGRRSRNPEHFPEPRPRRATELHHLAVGVVIKDSKALMVRGLDQNLLSDLWNFPAAFGATKSDAVRHLRERLRELLAGRLRFRRRIKTFRHSITYRSIEGTIHVIEAGREVQERPGRWVELGDLDRAAVSALARKVAREIFN